MRRRERERENAVEGERANERNKIGNEWRKRGRKERDEKGERDRFGAKALMDKKKHQAAFSKCMTSSLLVLLYPICRPKSEFER